MKTTLGKIQIIKQVKESIEKSFVQPQDIKDENCLHYPVTSPIMLKCKNDLEVRTFNILMCITRTSWDTVFNRAKGGLVKAE